MGDSSASALAIGDTARRRQKLIDFRRNLRLAPVLPSLQKKAVCKPPPYAAMTPAATKVRSSGKHEPQLVPHCFAACSASSLPDASPDADAQKSMMSRSDTLKQLHTTLPRALNPSGADALPASSR